MCFCVCACGEVGGGKARVGACILSNNVSCMKRPTLQLHKVKMGACSFSISCRMIMCVSCDMPNIIFTCVPTGSGCLLVCVSVWQQ